MGSKDIQPAAAEHEEQPEQPSSGGVSHRELIAEAKTVISSGRGAAQVPSHPTGNGTPAEVAGVLLGHQLDHFELQTLIGGGGMGAVFRARDTRLDRTVAIKVIPRVGEDPELQRRFRNEAQSAARLDHPNIARVYDVGQHGGWHYIVFECIEGTNLRDLVEQEGLLSVDDAVYYTRQVAEALEHAHRRGVTHRDIKPSNVLITPDGQVKLVDMGLARAQQLEVTDDMTASGVTLGTFDYISPEQARDPRDADVRSDIYSLGCTLYFALTGRPPYGGGTVLQKLLSHGSSPPPDPRTWRSDLSDSLVAVLHKMLAKLPHERYRRPVDLIADLYQLAERENLPRSLAAGSIAVIPESRFAQLLEHHLPWMFAASLLVLSTAWLHLLSSAQGDLSLSEPVPAQSVSNRNRSANPATDSGLGSDGFGANGENAPSRDRGGASGENRAENRAENRTDTNADNDSPDSVNDASGSERNVLDAGKPPKYFELANPQAGASPPLSTTEPDDRQPAADSPTPSVIRVLADATGVAGTIDEENRLLVSSLEAALAVARNDAAIETIELGPGRLKSGPVRWPRRELTIRGVDQLSILEFVSPAANGSATNGSTLAVSEIGNQRPAMIQLGAASVDFQNIHLVWNFPLAAEQGGALFRLDGGNTVKFSDASITIANSTNVPAVRVFERQSNLVPSPLAAIAPRNTPPLVAIKLKNTVIRGGMSMLALEQATLFELLWDNGLLAISGNMIESGGAAQSPINGPFQMRLSLNDVTVAPGGSLVAVQLRPGADRPIIVDREANRCVFTLDSQVPLIDLNGFPAAEIDRYLILRGRDNYYDSTAGRTQIVADTAADDQIAAPIAITRLLSSDRPPWIQEVSPQGIVVWREPLPQRRPIHTWTPQDFRQEGVLLPGFRLESLPPLPPSDTTPSGDGI
ncbi:serine/threonine-protein kinase [Planctomycetaceae bacterium SH139]